MSRLEVKNFQLSFGTHHHWTRQRDKACLMLLGVVPKRYRVMVLNSVLGLVKLLGGQLVRLAR